MSRLAELIEELCPDGVEYKPLSECVVLPSIPSGLKRNQYENSGSYPIVDQGRGKIAGFTCDETKLVRDVPGIVFGDHTREIKYVDYFFVPGADGVKWIRTVDGISIRYLFHCLTSLSIPSRGYNRHWILVREMLIPVPPLEVQREIVRILEQFTTLEAELEAELEARRTQYEHYRNHLLSYESLADCGPVSLVPLRECIELCFGERITKTQHAGTLYPVYGGGGASFMTDSFNRADEFVISRFALSEACVRFVSGEFWLLDSGITFNVNELCCDKRYVGQFLLSRQNDIYRRSAGAAQRNLKIAEFLSMEVPLPGLAEQRRIADLLDRFDALVNDISSGLPAEIAARRAQYEHYRDRLLSFPEKAASGDDVP